MCEFSAVCRERGRSRNGYSANCGDFDPTVSSTSLCTVSGLATATRYLYLTRHGEASDDEGALSARGRRQAVLLGERLRKSPLTAVHHGPLARTAETASLIAEQLPSIAPQASDAAGDYIPHVPERDELPAESADALLEFLAQFSTQEPQRGAELAAHALQLWAGPVAGDEPRYELVVTHNFLIGWLVAHALDAPRWRWLGLNHCHAALTIIRYPVGRAPSLVFYNDMSHLPPNLRWTGFPDELRV
jgi:broad specificity phosphatase PhoE